MSHKSPNQRKYEKTDHLGHIRKRPDTYVGSNKPQKLPNHCVADLDADTPTLVSRDIVYIPAMLRIFVEIVSNAIDNIYRSVEDDVHMSKIKITFDDETGETSVWNDGSWIPLDVHESGSAIPKMIFGELLTSDNYDDTRQRQGSGRNGYGAKLTNVFSTEFKIELGVPNEDGEGIKVYRQTWTNGMRDCRKAVITTRKTGNPYTMVTWTPDFEFFKIANYSKDLLSLYYRYIYDTSMISGCSGVSVILNKKKVPITNLKDYSKLFCDSNEILQIKTDDCVVVLVPDTSYNFVAFTNGVHNLDGGVHVDAWSNAIFKPMLAKFNKKNKPTVSIRDIKQFFRILIKADLPNPEFSSQSKTCLTAPTPKPKVTKKHIATLMKWKFADKVQDIIKGKELLTLKKVEKKKKTFQKIPGYDPANFAGTKKSGECVCIFTEGLSAKTYGARGIEKGFVGNSRLPQVKGRDYFGLFPLRGKLLNVRNASTQSISRNNEIKNAINALNLRIGVDYTQQKNFDTLNYGKVAILCDADVDGIHIKGLLLNMFHTLFPTLLQREDPYIISMETPIVKVLDGPRTHVFYDERKFKEFIKQDDNAKLRRKYYKGLGTSSNDEVKKTFGQRVIRYEHDEEADEHMNMVFSSSESDARKNWLRHYDPTACLAKSSNSKVQDMSITDFINQQMIMFSIDDCGRSLPHLLDGFKESHRKIMYSVFKRKLSYGGKSLKVAQLAGYTAEHSAYHHGEQCLFDTIQNLAADIVGKNNIPLLFRDGQYGTRLQGGKDAAAGRYIFTKLDALTRDIFIKDDEQLLPRHREDGELIEPKFYIPIIPMVLANGCQAGIGTGWSCSIPTYNPMDLIKACKIWMKDGIDSVPELIPWFRNFTGDVSKIQESKYSTSGVIQRQKNKVTISELPIGMWTDKYKEFLEDLLEKKLIKSLQNYSTPQKVKFVITEHRNGMKCTLDNLKLKNTITTTNMVLFTPKGKLKKFKNVAEILDNFCKCRLVLYKKRKAFVIKGIEQELVVLRNKRKYLSDVMEGNLVIFKRPEEDIIPEMETMGFVKLATTKKEENYDYLLNLPNRSFTQNKLDILDKDIQSKETKLKTIQGKTPEDIWMSELENLEQKYKPWLRKMTH